MNDTPWILPLLGTCLAAGCLWASLRLRRHARLLHDLPTSKTLGVFIGMVELKGTAESEEPLMSRLAGRSCVHYAWSVEERWSRTVRTTTTDAKGNRRTTTRHESGWTTVARGGESIPFYLRDDEGVVLVRPQGAKKETLVVFDETVRRGHPLYHGMGPPQGIAHSDHVRRFSEKAIPLHAPIYVVGTARERPDIVAPEIGGHSDAPMFLISVRSEERVRSGLGGWSWFWFLLGGLVAGSPLLVWLFSERQFHPLRPSPETAVLLPVAYLAVWAGTWVWMVYNSLVGLRERVRQASSLIDVQLKRRHDLIPAIVSALAALRSHEGEVQEALARLRDQSAASRPGEASGLARELRMVIERYPQLKSSEAFGSLHRQLVETEQRIALARAYYNEIATHFATRLEIVPDSLVARLGSMRPEPLLAAAGFERAAVPVHLAN